METETLHTAELRRLATLRRELTLLAREHLDKSRLEIARSYFERRKAMTLPHYTPHGLLREEVLMQTALNFAQSVEPDADILCAIMLTPYVDGILYTEQQLVADWGEDVASLIRGMKRVRKYSDAGINADQDNFRGLLLSLAADIRVIIMMIVENLTLMRAINLHPDQEWVKGVAFEANCLYAQLAHRLGLYKIKGELEDLSLKYTNRAVYKQIAAKLNETKRARDAYIAEFIEPVRRKLQDAGLEFEIKGRTKSISSIWAKIRKQQVDLNGIFDLFAIRVIIDTPPQREKPDCWLAYGLVTDMYTANPDRMRDWLTVPKSNGYESLHATVMGPGHKWVEVQFRTRRMDLVAEKGLAAHWRYKGGKGDGTDQWMNNVRDILETAGDGPMQLMKNLRTDAYDREVFAFTPKGQLLRLPAGATVLDFAFQIHSGLGAKCNGAVVNGRNRKIAYRIKNGDTIEINTSPTQSPKPDWLNIVTTSKAKNRIRQSLNEQRLRRAELGKETLERRARNRKLHLDETVLMRLIKKSGYKAANDFYADLADEKIDPGKFLTRYESACAADPETEERVSAGEFKLHSQPERDDEILTIGENRLRGMNYRFAKCCNPIHGDSVFGFISSDGVVKIHRSDCPNAKDIRSRYPYRLIRVRWSDSAAEGGTAVSLKVVGTDDIGIVTNLTSIIARDAACTLRNISIDAHDGIFQGYMTLAIAQGQSLTALIRKLQTVKGVKKITRI